MSLLAIEEIETRRKEFENLSQEIWQQPETAFEEFKTSDLIASYLEKNGFFVEREVAGLKTAIKAVWGTGSPSIGFLGELDALPNLSQKVSRNKDPITPGAPGHGCGHNLVAIGHLAAVIGLKAQMEKENIPGRIVYYGCPGEEAGTGKIYMARGHAFDDIDAFIHFHPGQMNMVGISAISSCSAKFSFFGKSAHPSINPQDGRSALEGVELLNIGVNYLRSHVNKDVSMSYIITDGGSAVNIIPDHASALYDLRALKRNTVNETYKRVTEIAEGAAVMSGTKVESMMLGCTYDLINNTVFMEILKKCFKYVPQEDYTEEEIALMKDLNDDDKVYSERMKLRFLNEGEEIHLGLAPMEMNYGSTDAGDISHLVPGITFRTACYPLGVEGHTWKSTVCCGCSIGTKGMIRAAKIMAAFSLHLLKNPQLLEKAKEKFMNDTEGQPYICSIGPDMPLPNAL